MENTVIVDDVLSEPVNHKSNQSSIDKITMELMMNRSHYKKYLSKQDPAKYKEHQEYIQKIKKYKLKLTNIMSELLDDSVKLNANEKYTRDINDTFNEYLKTCVKHLEIQELESSSNGHDSDMLFEQIIQDSVNSPIVNSSIINGPTIFVNPHYTMDMYVDKTRRPTNT